MKKLRNFWSRIPRPVRGCLDVVAIIILLLLLYISIGFPTITVEQEFRRIEKLNMVGPSQIVSHLKKPYADADDLIVGETEEGVLFFTRKRLSAGSSYRHSYEYYYAKKTGAITVLAAPAWSGFMLTGYSLPVYVFDDYPEAVRAEISVTVTGSETHNIDGTTIENDFSETFESSALRETEGHFYFTFRSIDPYTSFYNDSHDALTRLACVCNPSVVLSQEQRENTIVTATVWLYDSQDNLIKEDILNITSR